MSNVFSSSKDFYGKVIYTERLLYRHYGIGTGHGNVIHFDGKDPDDAIIVETSEREFSDGNKIYVCYRTNDAYPPDRVVERANAQIFSDFGGYDLINNNCEHFARWCATGKSTSTQIFFKGDDQNVLEKAIDIMFEPISYICAVIDDAIDDTICLFRRIFG